MACSQSNLHGALMFRNEMRLRWPQAWASALHSSISRVSTKTRPPRHGHAAAHSNTRVQKVWAHYQELSLIRTEEDEEKRNQWEFNPGTLITSTFRRETYRLQSCSCWTWEQSGVKLHLNLQHDPVTYKSAFLHISEFILFYIYIKFWISTQISEFRWNSAYLWNSLSIYEILHLNSIRNLWNSAFLYF